MPDQPIPPVETLPAVPPPDAPSPDAAPLDGAADTAATVDTAAVAETEPTPIAELTPAACAARLAELFPALFGDAAPKPLKLRIQVDIQARAPGVFSKRVLSGFLQRYTTGTAYLKALAHATERIDLDGQPAGPIADEHRAAAAAELQRRRALHDERRAAQRAAEREAQREAQRQQQAQQRQQHEEAYRQREAQGAERAARAALLRAFEATTLTRANFCALKGLAEADLDAALAQARQERDQQRLAPRPPPPGGPSGAGAPGAPRPPQAVPREREHEPARERGRRAGPRRPPSPGKPAP